MAGRIGLPDGRYLAREGEDERVLIVHTYGAPRPPRRGRRRVREVQPSEPEAVPVTRATVTTAEELPGKAQGSTWLESTARSPEARAAEVRTATRLINRALHALRAGAADPLVQEIGATRALAVRIGYGTGEQLAEGDWTEARELPPPRRGRLEDVEPQSRVAAVLAGRDEVHPAETFLVRARLDLEQGRRAEARFGIEAARAALDESPAPKDAELRKRLDELEERLAR